MLGCETLYVLAGYFGNQERKTWTNYSLQRGTHLGVYHCHTGISGMVNTGLAAIQEGGDGRDGTCYWIESKCILTSWNWIPASRCAGGGCQSVMTGASLEAGDSFGFKPSIGLQSTGVFKPKATVVPSLLLSLSDVRSVRVYY